MNFDLFNATNLGSKFSPKRNVVSTKKYRNLAGFKRYFGFFVMDTMCSSQNVRSGDDVPTAEEQVLWFIYECRQERPVEKEKSTMIFLWFQALPLPSFGFISTDDIAGSTQSHPTIDVKNFLKLSFSSFGEGTVLNDLSREGFDRLAFFEHVIDTLIQPQVNRRQQWNLIKSSTVDRFNLIVVCKFIKTLKSVDKFKTHLDPHAANLLVPGMYFRIFFE